MHTFMMRKKNSNGNVTYILFSVNYKSSVVVTDDSVLPYSCCDLSRAKISRSCPSDTLSTYGM